MRTLMAALLFALLLAACAGTPVALPSPALSAAPVLPPTPSLTMPPTATGTLTETASPSPTELPSATPSQTATTTQIPPVPNFSHIIIIVLENREYSLVIGQKQMPNLNQWAKDYTLLTGYYAVTHPSLPNYLAMMGGDTFGITTDCETCYVNKPSLPDLIEASGRTWITYQEDMPAPCFIGSHPPYAQKHNPFIYFDPIRLDSARCQKDVVPFTQFTTDLAANTLPDFVFITPNLCNDAHDCVLSVVDGWLGQWVGKILASPAFDARSLLVITFDEGSGNAACCGIPYQSGGGQIATLLISPLARKGFQDATEYTQYSLLKTIAAAWGLPELGHAGDANTNLIVAPWH